jgi:hypothetical protein
MHCALLDLRLCTKDGSQENPGPLFNEKSKVWGNLKLRQRRFCKAHFQEKLLNLFYIYFEEKPRGSSSKGRKVEKVALYIYIGKAWR